MRIPPNVVLRGLLKFVAVVLAAGVVGAGLGIALAELTGNGDFDYLVDAAAAGEPHHARADPVGGAVSRRHRGRRWRR